MVFLFQVIAFSLLFGFCGYLLANLYQWNYLRILDKEVRLEEEFYEERIKAFKARLETEEEWKARVGWPK